MLCKRLISSERLNFGAIGMVVGHEIIHAFDNNGRQFDAEGRLHDWWSKETADAFQSKATCFVDQYSNYSVEGPSNERVFVNGNLTLGENIADNGGLGISMDAWKLYTSRVASQQSSLPGLEKYSPEKV
jgi:endothelin-converting enzyme